MDKKQNMMLNAMCLYAVPELLQMTAVFSGLSQVLEKSMAGFVEALGAEKPAIEPSADLGAFFNDELDGLVNELIEQFHNQSDTLLDEYAAQFSEIESSGGFEKAQKNADYFISLLPNLKPLDQLLPAKNILAYISFMKNKDANGKQLLEYMDCFSPVFIQMETSRKEEIEQEEKTLEAWFSAALDGDIEVLEKSYKAGVDVDEKRSGKTALAQAVIDNNLQVVSYLLSIGATPVSFLSSDSPIMIAIENNRAQIVKVILNSGHEKLKEADLGSFFSGYKGQIIADEYFETARHILEVISAQVDMPLLASKAIKNNAHKILALCFDYGLEPSDEYYSDALTFIAVDECSLSALKVLLEQGADINLINSNDQSLIERAIDKNSKEIVDFLIKSGIKLCFSNHYTSHMFLLRLSTMIGLPADKCLLLNLFDPAAYDGYGRSFLHLLVSRHDENEQGTSLKEISDIVDILINKLKIDINQITENGDDTGLTLANHISVFEMLLSYKPDLSLQLGLQLGNNKNVISRVADMFDGEALSKAIKLDIDEDLNLNLNIGDMPLLHYCFKFFPQNISLLIEKGANVNSTDGNDLTILQKYIMDKELIEVHLLELSRRGADFSLKVKSGLPVFHALSAIYDGDTIKQVAKNTGVDVHVSDTGNNNAMMQACLAGNTSALMALSELGLDVNQVNVVGGNPLVHAVYEDDVDMFNLLVNQCGARTDVELAGKNLIFIANMIPSYDVLSILNELDKNK
ncbi:hypothetical protein MNBD_GAMMA11-2607 [hydrothermal vent metagenome]|uniref:Ankyrin repeat protein n=1 Tax=hydrothermal vent metagenome TaxID=652676 RepID=A0A3B0X529_9ZZZZ